MPTPSPSKFRPVPKARSSRGSALLWSAAVLLASLGVLFALLDAADGRGHTPTAEGSFGGPPVVNNDVDLVAPFQHGQPACPTAPKLAPEEVLSKAKARAACEREADVLIERLLVKMRAERRVREDARKERRSKSSEALERR